MSDEEETQLEIAERELFDLGYERSPLAHWGFCATCAELLERGEGGFSNGFRYCCAECTPLDVGP